MNSLICHRQHISRHVCLLKIKVLYIVFMRERKREREREREGGGGEGGREGGRAGGREGGREERREGVTNTPCSGC